MDIPIRKRIEVKQRKQKSSINGRNFGLKCFEASVLHEASSAFGSIFCVFRIWILPSSLVAAHSKYSPELLEASIILDIIAAFNAVNDHILLQRQKNIHGITGTNSGVSF